MCLSSELMGFNFSRELSAHLLRLSLMGREGLFVGLESQMQKVQRLTTYSSGVTPMPHSCLPWSWVPSRTKARFCWANWFCYNSPTPNKEVMMFFILSPFNLFFIKFWNISHKNYKSITLELTTQYKEAQHYKQRQKPVVMLLNSIHLWSWKHVWKLFIHSFVELVSLYYLYSFTDMLLLGRERRQIFVHNIIRILNEFIIIYVIISFILDINFFFLLVYIVLATVKQHCSHKFFCLLGYLFRINIHKWNYWTSRYKSFYGYRSTIKLSRKHCHLECHQLPL